MLFIFSSLIFYFYPSEPGIWQIHESILVPHLRGRGRIGVKTTNKQTQDTPTLTMGHKYPPVLFWGIFLCISWILEFHIEFTM